MADIAAANVTNKTYTVIGNICLWIAKVKGDGAGLTIKAPVARIVGVCTGNIDDTSAIPAISSSGNTVTYASTPTTDKYHWLFVFGTP